MPKRTFGRRIAGSAYRAISSFTSKPKFNNTADMSRAMTRYNPRATSAPTRSRRKTKTPWASALAPYVAYNITKRMRRKPRLRATIRPTTGAGSTNSYSTFGSRRVPKYLYNLYKQNQHYEYQFLTSNRPVAAFGKQAITTKLYGAPNQLNLIEATLPDPGQGNITTNKYYMKNYKSTLTFTNVDLATAYVTMYEITPRFHILDSANGPTNAWDAGFEEQKTGGLSNDDYTDVYSSPFDSQRFCLFYKVNKVTKFELAQGQSHCHKATYHVNRPVHDQIQNSFTIYSGIYKANMIVISGTPINDQTTRANVSTSSVAVDIVEYVTYEYTFASNLRTIRSYQNTLDPITTAELVSIGAGLVVAEDEA